MLLNQRCCITLKEEFTNFFPIIYSSMNFIYTFFFNKFAWGPVSFKKSTVKLDTVCNFLFFTHQLICKKKTNKKQQNYVTFKNWIFVPKKWNFPMIWIQSHRIKKHQFQYVIVTCKFDIIDIFLQVRQVEYKDKLDDEWEMFQRAIKEENHVSYSNHTSLASI